MNLAECSARPSISMPFLSSTNLCLASTTLNWPLVEQGVWLRQAVQGRQNYHAIPGNMPSLETFYAEIRRTWLHALRRRSQRSRMAWSRFEALADRWIPRPKILLAYPNVRFDARHPK